ILDARLSTANSEIKFRQAGMCGLCFLSLIRARGRRLGSAQCSIDLRLNAPSRQGRQPRLCSAGLELVTEPKLPLPDVRLGRCDDRVFDALVNHSAFPGFGTRRQGPANPTETVNPPIFPGSASVGKSGSQAALAPVARSVTGDTRQAKHQAIKTQDDRSSVRFSSRIKLPQTITSSTPAGECDPEQKCDEQTGQRCPAR